MGKEKIKEATVKDLIPDDKNFNLGNPYGEGLIEQSFDQFGAGRSVLIDKNNRIIAGNKSTQKFVEGGGEKVLIVETTGDTLVAVKRTDVDLDTPRGREFGLADNATAVANIQFDFPAMQPFAAQIDFPKWGIDFDFQTEDKKDDIYSKNIEAPIYEAKNEKPPISELFDEAKVNDLIREISNAEIDDETKDFLIKAAQRHRVFSYEKIADFYAHSSKEIQDLMEKSALVIIDFNKAIEYGYVQLTKEIAEIYAEEYGE